MNKEKIEKAFTGKKKTENLVILLILMIIVFVAINYIWNGDSSSKSNKIDNTVLNENYIKQVSNNENESEELETKLENTLSNISGAGKVKVMITYLQSKTMEPMYDETLKESNTTENDNNGGTRVTSEIDNQKQIIYKQNSDGSKEPLTKSYLSPKMEGAIVIAQGAKSAEVKTNIIQAVEAVTGLPTHKIQVFEMEDE